VTVVRYIGAENYRDVIDAKSAMQRLANKKRRRVVWFWNGDRMPPIWPDVSVMMEHRKERSA